MVERSVVYPVVIGFLKVKVEHSMDVCCVVLYCVVCYCIVLRCIALYFIVLCCIVLRCIALCFIVCVVLCSSASIKLCFV